nr:phosphotransferase [Lachnospiraceae bacterium]
MFEEITHADTVGGAITANPEAFDAIMEKFVDLYKKIHSTPIKDLGEFPDEKDIWLGWAKGMEPYYTSAENDFLKKMIASIPERPTMVHSDYHENNVLYREGEMILIDMADVGYGHPIFDLAGGAFRAHCSDMPERKASHGLSKENMHRFWDAVVRLYFSPQSEAQCREIKEMCEAFGFLRSALFPMKHSQISAELRNLHIADARKNLFPRREWALAQTSKLDEYFSVAVGQKG